MKKVDAAGMQPGKDEVELIEMGKFYFLSGKYDEAIREFEKVIKLNPRSADAYFNIGVAREAQNDMESARKIYEKVIKLVPGHQSARGRLDKLIRK
jgi:superkiller protein 3